jgi:hypothetical protein
MTMQQIETNQHVEHQKSHGSDPCCHFPDLTRLRYFYGQMLGQHDFQTEQNYFREKLKLHNRCLHGYGTVCGLEVEPEPVDENCKPASTEERTKLETEYREIERRIKELVDSGRTDEETRKQLTELRAHAEKIKQRIDEIDKEDCVDDEEKPTRVVIGCGFALDCEGNEILLQRPLAVDLWRYLSEDDKKHISPDGQTLYLSICYCELPVDPVRPVLVDNCGASSECVYGKLKDSIRIKVTIDPPEDDTRCDACCDCCTDKCLLLARIDGSRRGRPLSKEQISNGVRRMIGLYKPVTITGISWTHGAKYTPEEARDILGTSDQKGGLKIEFSRPVQTSTLTQGVIDLWVVEGGRGRSGNIYHLGGDYVDLPSDPTTSWVKFRQVTEESLQSGDRVIVTIKTAFILDECCYPVDGDHVGGRVPILRDYEANRRGTPLENCQKPPNKFGPWTSGNGSVGGGFESWFYVSRGGNDDPRQQAQY